MNLAQGSVEERSGLRVPRPDLHYRLGGQGSGQLPPRPGANRSFLKRRLGQSTVEYALIVAAVAAALAAMSTYVRRAVQANFKQLEEAVNGSVEQP